jgi:hypothetical protein
MAILTTVDGREIKCSPSSVTVLTDYDVFTHAAVTSVYGVRKAVIEISETPLALIERLGIQKTMATLTRSTGRSIWICGDAVTALSEPLPHSYVEGVNTVIEIGAIRLGVAESIDIATCRINAHRKTPFLG